MRDRVPVDAEEVGEEMEQVEVSVESEPVPLSTEVMEMLESRGFVVRKKAEVVALQERVGNLETQINHTTQQLQAAAQNIARAKEVFRALVDMAAASLRGMGGRDGDAVAKSLETVMNKVLM